MQRDADARAGRQVKSSLLVVTIQSQSSHPGIPLFDWLIDRLVLPLPSLLAAVPSSHVPATGRQRQHKTNVLLGSAGGEGEIGGGRETSPPFLHTDQGSFPIRL
jgi:hypothetical protein